MSKVIQHRRSELILTIIVIILSGASASLVIFAPLDIISYATYRDVAIIPSVIAIFAIGIYHVQNSHVLQIDYSREWQLAQLHHLH